VLVNGSGNRSNDQTKRTITYRRTEERVFLPLSVVVQMVSSAIVRSLISLIERTITFSLYFFNEANYSRWSTRRSCLYYV
jgi:hypothetical protein